MSTQPKGVVETPAEPEPVAPSEPTAVEPDPTPAVDPIAAAVALLEANGYAVRKRTVVQRALMEKADPLEVAAYFESTGLTRKELADAVGVCVSVIATVQNPNGDRWSATRFAAARILIDAYATAKAAAAAAATQGASI